MRVALLDDYQDIAAALAPWDSLGPSVQVTRFTDHLADDDGLVARLEPFEAVVAMRERTPFPRRRLERLERLQLLVTTGMGNASIDMEAARELGIVVAGTGYSLSATVELAWALILAVTRNVCVEDAAIRAGEWQHTIGPELAGGTLGVVGLGHVGSKVAAIGRAFEMNVVAWSENLKPAPANALGAVAVSKEELFRSSDVVTVHLKLSGRTEGVIGQAEFELMKPTAYLVNTSRGPVVQERALLDALDRGVIAGAGLDVFDEEPLPDGHPLRAAPRTVLTPHIGYVSRTAYEQFYRDAVEDIAAFLRNEPVRVLN